MKWFFRFSDRQLRLAQPIWDILFEFFLLIRLLYWLIVSVFAEVHFLIDTSLDMLRSVCCE